MTLHPNPKVVEGSFRDPDGFLFTRDGILYRQINRSYQENYFQLMESGLYEVLVQKGLLISHEEKSIPPATDNSFKVIQPERVSFISYPYEWCFEQLKDAALVTLEIQRMSIEYGMSLKDASAFNIQFHRGKPLLIDSLSFKKYEEGYPWVAYKQFCEHFLAPLALAAYCDERLQKLFRVHIEGIPLDLASRLLPVQTWLHFGLLSHLHLHAKAQKHYGGKKVNTEKRGFTKLAMLGLIDNLKNTIQKLHQRSRETVWKHYYAETNYSEESLAQKKKLVGEFLKKSGAKTVWDLGANQGLFSRLASAHGIQTLSFDKDAAAIQKNYIDSKTRNDPYLLPLVLDLMNPTPRVGWAGEERRSLMDRQKPDLIMALALIHHLAIGENVPLYSAARFLSSLAPNLMIEFIPKMDSQTQRLLQNRKDIFPQYHQSSFEEIFSSFFKIREMKAIQGTERTLYWMQRK